MRAVTDKCLILRQIGKYRWQLVAPKGHIMIDDLVLSDYIAAENWIKSYVSSYNDWSYKIVAKEAL